VAENKDPRLTALAEQSERLAWDDLVEIMADWQGVQFPTTTVYSCATHLHREAIEIVNEAMNKQDSSEEWADAFHLVIQGGVKAAGGLESFRAAVEKKLGHNMFKRKWQAPDDDGVVEHVRAEDDLWENPFD
jgi:hypothetical protein